MSTTNNYDAQDLTAAVLREPVAAIYIDVSPSYLRASRLTPPRTDGPPYVRMGRAIRYLKIDLDLWLQSRRVNPADDVKDQVCSTTHLPDRVTGRDGKTYPASRHGASRAASSHPDHRERA